MMKEKIYYFSGTHWDREWYQTFQGFRLKLIEVVDDLLDCLENQRDIEVFHFDGQTIVLDDYVEVCPENKERLKKLIEQGRILIGPWYCMPDENLVSGESLIRNIQKGREKCHDWGCEPWNVGYICDIFGHTAQMPQIFNGFGIKSAVLGRGTTESTTPAVFCWEAPDKSTVTALKLPDKSGYGSFSMDVCGQKQKNNMRDFNTTEFKEALKEYLEHERQRTDIGITVVWDAMDHEPIHRDIPNYLEVIRQMYPESEVTAGNLANAFEEISDKLSLLPVKKGELLETAQMPGLHLHLLIHTLSSRQSIKSRNDHCQNLLEKNLEPMGVYLAPKGIKWREKILDIAWENLMMNHPHDSICGCSIDRVHSEMLYRFSQVESITQALIENSLDKLANGRSIIDGNNNNIVIINPMPIERSGIFEIEVPFSCDYPKWSEPFNYQSICAFRLYSTCGEEIPYSIKNIKTGMDVCIVSESVIKSDLYTILLPLSFKGQESVNILVKKCDTPVRDMGRIATGNAMLENEFITATINPDGTVSIFDKTSQKTYGQLLNIIDSGEIGDGWNSVAPVNNRMIIGGTVKEIAVIHNSSLMGCITVKKELLLPKKMIYGTKSIERSDESEAVECRFVFSLYSGERALRVEIEVDNRVRDHVMKLHIPTGISEPEYEVSAPFTFCKRPTGVNTDTYNWKECDKLEKPMAGIVLKRNSRGEGLCLISCGGLHECGADNDAQGSCYVTLLRGFEKTLTTNGEKGSQELFMHNYSFSLVPLDQTITNSTLQRQQIAMQTQLYTFVTNKWSDNYFLTVSPNVCVSALKNTNEGVILRVYNPEDADQTFDVSYSGGISSAYLCDLGEIPKQEVNIKDSKLQIIAKHHKIITLLLK